ncbi:MAG TPA: type II secretion system F family protein [candidate division Zixibacteria bacterium]|nr:type II secretion system F family protein [candidate division Zixibacteria bacterium]
MPTQFKYRAVSDDGSPTDGIIAADSNAQVQEFLAEQKLTPVWIKPARKNIAFYLSGVLGGGAMDELITFTNSMSTLYRAGVPLLRALSLIRIGQKDSRFNYAISQIRLSLQSGRALSTALGEFEDIFPPIYVASVAAGEESGKLDEILDELALVMEKEMTLTRLIKSGVRYPTMVIIALAVAFLVLVTYVVPKFVAFYGAFEADLPIFTKALIWISGFLKQYWAIILGVVAAGFFGFRKAVQNDKVRLALDTFMLKVPVLGQLVIKGNVARFSMMFRILLQSGLPMIRSMEVLIDSVKNQRMALEIKKMREMFQEGRDGQLADSGFEYFPEMALQMISIGLESGSLDRMLTELGEHYRKDVEYTSKHLTSILEPILTVVMGVAVLILALAIFLPMWNLIKVFQGH